MKNIITLLLALVLLLGASALADDRADMLVAAAVNELGYSATKGGYSKYGEWGGSAYGEWCSEFVSWCVNFADEYYGTSMLGSDYPLQTSCEGGSMWYKERGRYVTVNGGLRGEEGQFYLSDGVSVADRPYIPQKGDLIYIEWYKYNRLDHVGIVEMSRRTRTARITSTPSRATTTSSARRRPSCSAIPIGWTTIPSAATAFYRKGWSAGSWAWVLPVLRSSRCKRT